MDSLGKIITPNPIDEDESGCQEASSFYQSFDETSRFIMTNNNIRDAGEKTLREIRKWLTIQWKKSKQTFHKLYYDHKTGYDGVKALYQVRKLYHKITLSQTHQPIRRSFKRQQTRVTKRWQLNITDVSSMTKYNDGYTILSYAIDVLCKYVLGSDGFFETRERVHEQRISSNLQNHSFLYHT